MRRTISLFVIFSVAVGVVLKALGMRGILRGGECGPVCDCSIGVRSCRCGHPTCLTPVG